MISRGVGCGWALSSRIVIEKSQLVKPSDEEFERLYKRGLLQELLANLESNTMAF